MYSTDRYKLTTGWCAFLSTFGSSGLQGWLLNWTHVTDGDCRKVEQLLLLYADVDADRVADVGSRQKAHATRHSSDHYEQRQRPVTLFHSSWNQWRSVHYQTAHSNRTMQLEITIIINESVSQSTKQQNKQSVTVLYFICTFFIVYSQGRIKPQ